MNKVFLLTIKIIFALIIVSLVVLFISKNPFIETVRIPGSPKQDVSINEKEIPEGFKLYTSKELKFEFWYPESSILTECPDVICLSVGDVLMDTLSTYNFDRNRPETSLIAADLFCTADGPEGSRTCKNIIVDKFTNSKKISGYKITRDVKITGNLPNIPNREYQDEVYVFILPKIVQGKGLSDHSAILFSTRDYTKESSELLKTIADSLVLQ